MHKEKGGNPKLALRQCPICGKDHDVNMLVLMGDHDYKQTCPSCGCVAYGGFDKQTCPKCKAYCSGVKKEPIGDYEKLRMPPKPCKECAGYMKQGVVIMSVKDGDPNYRTGGFWVVKEEAMGRVIDNPEMLADVLKRRVCLIGDSVCEKLGLVKADKEETT